MKPKFLMIIVALFAMTMLLTSCSNQEGEQVVLRYGYSSNSQPVIDSMHEFKRLIEEKTDGDVTIQFYPDSQLGSEVELIELTQTGAIDFTKVSASALEGFSKSYSIFGVPYLFDSEEHFFKVMENEEIMTPIYESTRDMNFVGLTYYDSGQRSFYSTEGPIYSPDDLKGMKIRTMQSETAIKMVELLGASAVPMSSSEVFTSLQSNLINGAENNEFALYTAGHAAVANYYSYDEHTRVPDIVIMNSQLSERLTQEQFEAVKEAAVESTEFEKKAYKAAVEEEKKLATEKYNAEYFEDIDKAPFLEAVQPLHEQFKNNPQFSDVYNSIRNLAK